MRKIEERMINAVVNRVNYRENNTKVYNTNKGVFVYLYETIIYANVNDTEYYSDGGYNTITTSSRLRALRAEYTSEVDYWRGSIEYFYLTKSNLDVLLEFISKIVFKLQ